MLINFRLRPENHELQTFLGQIPIPQTPVLTDTQLDTTKLIDWLLSLCHCDDQLFYKLIHMNAKAKFSQPSILMVKDFVSHVKKNLKSNYQLMIAPDTE